ncbi:Single-stranded DNA-binding protein [Fusobacterium necrophorum subsp. funduliforme]|uniref:single-stranded DNA-binding protein n=1 Tax=Fusobacterium necrophorum TaxID=859 RepID=UPI00370DFB21
MKLEKGDIIKTALGDSTMVLDVKDKQAILFSGKQFAMVSGIKLNEKIGRFEWENGRYADNLKNISNMQNNSFENMRETLLFLAEYNHSDFVKGIISLEIGINDEAVLESAYDNYMGDSGMSLIDENFLNFIEEGLLKAEENKENKEEKIGQNNEDKENMNKTDEKKMESSEKESDTKNMLNINGNIVKDVEIKNLESKDGEKFKVANFSIAENDKNGDVKYINCFAYNDKIDKVKDLKKGDFVHIFGKEKISRGSDGKEYTNLKVYSANLLKAKEKINIKNAQKFSTLGKLREYKEKAKNLSKNQNNMRIKKDMER